MEKGKERALRMEGDGKTMEWEEEAMVRKVEKGRQSVGGGVGEEKECLMRRGWSSKRRARGCKR